MIYTLKKRMDKVKCKNTKDKRKFYKPTKRDHLQKYKDQRISEVNGYRKRG